MAKTSWTIFLVLFTFTAISGCDSDPGPSIPIEIVSITPAVGTIISNGTHFTVVIDYTLPSMEADLSYRIDIGFLVEGGGSIDFVHRDLTSIRGEETFEFDFSPNNLMVYPYELRAYLMEINPSYEYIMERTGSKTYN